MKKLTEKKNPKSENIDKQSIYDILNVINEEDSKISYSIKESLKDIEEVIKKVIEAFNNNGKLYYVGCGSSGRLGVLDAAECPPTFSVSHKLVQGVIAGGNKAMYKSIEGCEDSYDEGKNVIIKKNIDKNDVILGISANGSAKFVLGALDKANQIGAYTSLLTFNKIRQKKFINKTISILVGPEILTGSTRMKAGTATKMILNMISTVSMIKTNKTFNNLMVDLKVSNNKLLDRGVRIISDITELNYEESKKILDNAKNNVKVAIVMELKDLSYSKSLYRLKKYKGNLRDALK